MTDDSQKTKEKRESPKAQKEEEKPSQPSQPSNPSEAKKASKPVKEVKISSKLGKIIEGIEKLTVIELADLVKALEEKFGVSAVPMRPAATATAEGKSTQEQASSEQTIFNVILTQTGANKFQVIKALRGIKPTLGLQEAKKMTEETPQEVLSQVNKKEAEEAKKKLEAVGATVELK